MDFSGVVISPAATVGDAIAQIDRGGHQIALVLDDAGVLVGVVSDGDVRRGLLRGLTLESPASQIMNPSPAVVGPQADQDEVVRLKTSRGVRHVPVVDADGRIVDLIGDGERIAVPLSTPVVLMAGGRGQRLYPITKDIPKPMVLLGGVPMIE